MFPSCPKESPEPELWTGHTQAAAVPPASVPLTPMSFRSFSPCPFLITSVTHPQVFPSPCSSVLDTLDQGMSLFPLSASHRGLSPYSFTAHVAYIGPTCLSSAPPHGDRQGLCLAQSSITIFSQYLVSFGVNSTLVDEELVVSKCGHVSVWVLS